MKIAAESSKQISAAALTTFDVDPGGKFVRLHLRDHSGEPAVVTLPTECIDQLLMSMPKMLQTAIQNRHGDESLRMVFPLRKFNVEQGEMSAAGMEQFILTLATADGFAVSFSATPHQLSSMSDVIVDDVLEVESLPTPSIRYS